jgi:hypothetical protein
MTSRSIMTLATLFTLMLSVAVVAASNRKAIQLTEPTLVGSGSLKLGENWSQRAS